MQYSDKFKADRDNAIDHIQRGNMFIDKLLPNSHLLQLNEKQTEKLRDIHVKNKKLLHKLQSNEFEIAIVGLEKAGKSTFANALIESSVLPSAPERCTFTATQLKNGADKAIIEFYNEDEFNAIFRQLLIEIKYPNAENESFRNVSLDKFEAYFSSLEEMEHDLYKNHIGKTDEEIKDIIKSRDKLRLDGDTIHFSGDELTKDIFQAYIKGENKGADTSKPRSVKRIQIESSKLKEMQTAIIYDVPGFDSPTKIHIRQTEERLKAADAIILVTNVGRNPSIQGTSLSVINKNTDADGIALKDKLFVFGNQIDTANNVREANGNKEILIKDVEKYKIGSREKVFTGSALKYLVDKKIIETEFNPSFPIEDGLEEMRAALVRFYETERFDILKLKLDANRSSLKDIFNEIKNNLEFDLDENFSDTERNGIILEAGKEIEASIESCLTILKEDLKKEIWGGNYFSQKFAEDVGNFDCFHPIDDTTIQAVKRNVSSSVTLDVPIEKLNQSIRNKLHDEFLQKFSSLILRMTDEKAKQVEIRILRTCASSICGQSSGTLYDAVEESVGGLIKKLTKDISHNEGRFTYLIERFSRDIFDILIANPLLSQDRKEKFEKSKKEFRGLDALYKNGNGMLINMLLIGEQKECTNEFLPRMDSLRETLRFLILNASTAGMLGQGTSTPEVGIAILKEAHALLSSLTIKISSGDYVNSEKIISDNKYKRSRTEEEVLNEINNDIVNLRLILQEAVVPAINLELAFMNALDKQIKVLIESFNIQSNNSSVINDFLAKLVPTIRKSELDGINKKIEEHKTRIALLDEMKLFSF
ncbi:MAG: hypothetical protein RIR79_317 [Pseudomonadota bacterium]|jgi:GTPase SAR1 family protein